MKLKDVLKTVESVAGGVVAVTVSLWSKESETNNRVSIVWFSQGDNNGKPGCRSVSAKTVSAALKAFRGEYARVEKEKAGL
jgi:hypothetical protein